MIVHAALELKVPSLLQHEDYLNKVKYQSTKEVSPGVVCCHEIFSTGCTKASIRRVPL